MSSRSVILALAALLAVSSSCTFRKVREESIPYVREIIQDKADHAHQLVVASAVPDPQGEILVIGSAKECAIMCETLATIDVRDNVDGSFRPDGLPDFAGETISCIMDTTGRPEKYILAPGAEDDQSEGFRKYLLNGFINALDTVYHVTPYDLEGIGRRKPAKLIISADPFLTMLVRHDVDTLYTALGSKVHVIAPSDEISDAILNARTGRDVVAAVLHDPDFADSDMYHRRFMKYASTKGSFGSSISSFPVRDSVENKLTAFLDDYIEAGYTRPLNVLVAADFHIDVDELKSEYAMLLSVLNEDSARYSKYLAKDFTIISSIQNTIGRCYDLLRSENLFSHNISKPQVIVYYHHPDPQDNDVRFLVPSLYVQN